MMTAEIPELIAGDCQLWLLPDPLVVTPGRAVALGATDDWKAILRRLVRLWDLEDEAREIDVTLDQMREAFGR